MCLFLRRHNQPVFGFVFPDVDALEACKNPTLCPIATIPRNSDFSTINHHWLVKQQNPSNSIFFASAVTKSALLRITEKVS